MGCTALWVILLTGTCLLINTAEGKAKRRRRRSDDNDELPTLDKLFEGGNADGTSYTYEGCDITVSNDGNNNVALNLTDESCEDIMSVPRLFKKLTNQDLDDWTKFAPLRKFNVDTVKLDLKSKDVSIEATAKESFCFLRGTKMKVKKGELAMDFNFDDEFSFADINLDVSGEVPFGNKLTASYSLSKEKNTTSGDIVLQLDSLQVADFVNLVTRLKKKGLPDETVTALFKEVVILNPKFTGSRDEKGNTELAITGSATEVPGIGMANVFILVQSQKGKATEIAVIAKLSDLRPAALISKLVARKLSKKDIDSIPIINDVTLDMVVEFSTADMGMPTDTDVLALLQKFSSEPMVMSGINIKFVVPFKTLIEKNNADYSVPVTDLDYYLSARVCGKEISFDFGDSEFELKNLLMAFIPDFATKTFESIFGNTTIKFDTFSFNYDTKEVTVVVNATDLVTLGSGFLTVERAAFSLRHDEREYWDFGMCAEMKIGDGILKLHLSREGEKANEEETYVLKGSISSISVSELVDYFDIKSTAGKVVKKMTALQFDIDRVRVSAEYNEDGDTNFRIQGQVTFFKWKATFEGYITKKGSDITVDEENEMAFGLVVQDVSLGQLASDLFSTEKKAVNFPKAEWLSGITITLIVGKNDNDAGEMVFEEKVIKDALERVTGPYSTALPEDGGAIFDATLAIPEDCQGESICEFIKTKLGTGAELGLSGTMSRFGFTLKAGFKAEIQISPRFTLKEASLNMKIGGGDAEFAIEGICAVQFNTTTRDFRAVMAVSATGTFTLTFSVSGPMWKEAFGLKYLSVGNFEMSVGINILSLAPTFTLAGELHLGDPAKAIEAKLAGGFESGGTPGFFVYAQFNKLSIQSIMDAFNIDIELPTAVLESGFPEGLIVGMSMPTSKFIETFNVELSAGFTLKGKFNILGVSMYCEMEVNLPSEFHLEAQFDIVSIAGGAIKLSGVSGEDGPYLKIDLEVGKETSLKIMIDAYIEILRIGMGARIALDDDGFHFEVSGKIGGLFELTLEVEAPYGKWSDQSSKQWMVKACINENVMEKIKTGAIDEVNDACNATQVLEKENSDVNGEANSWFEKAMGKVNKEKAGLLKLEDEFQKEIQELEDSKKDLKQKCVAKCASEREWVGGFGMQTCHIGSKTVECPYWIEHKTLRESPYCLAKCEAGKWNVLNRISGFMDSGKLIALEEEMEVKNKILEGVRDLLFSSKSLVEYAEIASKKVGQLKNAVVEAAAAIKKFAVDKLFYMKHLCIEANMDLASKGLCFVLDAEFFIGGKDGKRVLIANKEVCFNMKWAAVLGAHIAKAAFKGIDTVKEKANKVRDFFSKSTNKADAVQMESSNIDKKHNCPRASKRCINGKRVKKLLYYRSEAYSNLPDITVRNDESMQAFRDIYDMEDDVISVKANQKDEINPMDEEYKYAMDIDANSLRNSDPAHKCKRTRDVMNLYAGIVDSINLLEGKNTKVKSKYEKFIKKHTDKVKELEKRVKNDTIAFGLPAKEAGKAMFYVERAKKGIALWKGNFDAKYVMIDQSSLRNWRGYMAENVADQGLDLASFVDVLNTASTETAQRMDIPSGAPGITQSLAAAQQVVRSLLTNDEATFSSKDAEIKNLSDQVNWMLGVKEQMACFKD